MKITVMRGHAVLPSSALRVFLLGWVAALAVGCGARQGEPAGEIDTVVLISIDSLRADHVGAYGYERPTTPRLDALAREGMLFEHAYSTTSWTLASHAALLTGLDDLAHGVVDNGTALSAEIEALATSLRREGIRTVGFFAGPYLKPPFGLDQGFDVYLDCTGYQASSARAVAQEAFSDDARARRQLLEMQGKHESKGEVGPVEHFASHLAQTNPIILDRFAAWLEESDPAQRHFLFFHLWDVHFDYVPPREYLEMFDPSYAGGLKRDFYNQVKPGIAPRDLEHVIARYDGEIRYTDDTVAKVLDGLASRGLLRNAATIVLADHGEEFLEHGRRGHGRSLYREVTRIPLIIHAPGRVAAGQRNEDVVSLVDIHPTICALFGASCPVRSGSDLLDASGGARRSDALLTLRFERKSQDALVRNDGTLIRWNHQRRRQIIGPNGQETPATEGATDLERALDRRIALAERLRASLGPVPRNAPSVDAHTRRQLEELGYVE
jgi:arylsulfatase A-like enzyme